MVVFDLDGTLIDSVPDLALAMNGLLAERDRPAVTAEQVRGFIGDGATRLVERSFEASGGLPEDVMALVLRFRSLYAADVASQTLPYDGIVSLLDELEWRGIPIALCTNKPAHHTRLVCDALDLTRRFGCIVAGDTLPVKKPDPAPLLRAIAEMGGGPALMVGDGRPDQGAAIAAGVPFVWAGYGYGTGLDTSRMDAVATESTALGAVLAPWVGRP